MQEPSAASHRPVLVAVTGRDTVRVSLRHRERLHVGEADAAVHGGAAAAAAAATLSALNEITPPAASFRLDWCGVIEPSPDLRPVVLVVATVTVSGVPMPQSGTALVSDDVPLASARAALDAMNRRLQILGV